MSMNLPSRSANIAPSDKVLQSRETVALVKKRARLGQLATVLIVIYSSLAVVFVANPKPVADWLDDFEPNFIVKAAQSGVDRVMAFSDKIGLAGLSREVRIRTKSLMHRPQGSI